MLKLKVKELLEENKKSKYWLHKQFDMTYQNFSNMLNNKTSSIKYEVLEKLTDVFHCKIDDLFSRE